MKSVTKIAIGALIFVKIVIGSIFIYQLAPDNSIFNNTVIAAEVTRSTGDTSAGGETPSVAETIDLEFLIQQRAELKIREENLDKKQEELVAIQTEIRKKLKVLSRLREEINDQMASKQRQQDKKLKHLLKVYAAMKPQRAAGLIEKLEIEFSVALLSQMKGEAVGSILSFVDLDKAARISEGLAKSE